MYEMEMEVFKSGDYGDKGKYESGDLDAIVSDYDPKMHEAPVTVDHAQSGPAYGWVKGLRRAGDRLLASVRILSREFLDWLKSGAYKKRSIELYRKFSGTGRPYLRALSFLGAAPPEVKGLEDPVFADAGEFISLDFTEEKQPEIPAKEEENPKIDLEAILRERDDLKSEIANLKTEKRRLDLAMFCERLKQEGKLLPAWEEKGILEFLLTLDETGALKFGDAGDKSPLQWFCAFLEEIPRVVCLEEIAGDAKPQVLPDISLPQPGEGVAVSPESVETHKRVLAFQEKHPGASYTEALSHVIRNR